MASTNLKLLWGGACVLILLGFLFPAGQTAARKIAIGNGEKEMRFDFGMYPKDVPIPPSGASQRKSENPSPPRFSPSKDLDEPCLSCRKGIPIPPSEPNPRTSDSFSPPPPPFLVF